MKVVSLSMVRNEADIVESWVRYHAEQLDFMAIVCNRSADNTREILTALAEEGLPLELHDREALDYAQSDVMTSLMRDVARRHRPDWLIPLDADEFLASRTTQTARSAIAALPAERVARLDMPPYLPCEDDPPDSNVLKRIRRRTALPAEDDLSDERARKVIFPLAFAKRNGTRIAAGNHWLIAEETGNLLQSSPIADPFLAHFPIRSTEQIRTKAAGSWISLLATPDAPPGLADHWRGVYDALHERDRLDVAALRSLALYGVLDGPPVDVAALELAPLTAQFDLRYDQRPADSDAVVRDSAVAYAELVADLRAPSPARRRARDAARLSRRALRRLGLHG